MSTRVLEAARKSLDTAKEAGPFTARESLIVFAENLLAIITDQQNEIDQLKSKRAD